MQSRWDCLEAKVERNGIRSLIINRGVLMRAVSISFLVAGLVLTNSIAAANAPGILPVPAWQQSTIDALKSATSAEDSEFDLLRIEGFVAVYNLDYQKARDRFYAMTRAATMQRAR